jgi:2-polyprenyl-3-methyl-5-hydroxy-6-metoxy-1,4-benzoquinol methylase
MPPDDADLPVADAVATARAAFAHASSGRLREAEEAINSIPLTTRRDPTVWPHFIAACGAVQEADALLALRALWEVYVWADEPLKARELLRMVPVAAEGNPMVEEMRRLTDSKLAFLDSWESYRKVYGDPSFDAPMYGMSEEDRREFLSHGRTQAVVSWFASHQLEPLRVLSVGAQGCVLERELLVLHPRLKLMICDANPRALAEAEVMAKEFRGRVMQRAPRGFYDWSAVHHAYDVIVFLEVIEHLPDQEYALDRLRRYLIPGGTLLLSTPVGGLGANTRLTREPDSHAQWGHVRAQRPEQLMADLERAGFTSSIEIVDGGMTMLAIARTDDAR